MRKGWFALVAILLLLSTVCACHGGLNPFSASPSAVARQFYTSCNAGDYSKAEDTLSVDARNLLHGDMGALAGGVKGVCDKMSKGGTMTSVDIVSETVRGEGADVNAKLHFKDGSTTEDHEPMVKEKGAWKIATGD
ncbi:MAG: DUF4878 domain-containing protein [Terracidiphilus sp.]